MLNFPRFQYRNFHPRDGVRDVINTLLEMVSEISPSDSTCEAHIRKEGSKFLFEIVVYSAVGTFRSRKHYDTNQGKPWDRNWHIPIVQDMCQELWVELKAWNMKRVV